MSTTNSRYADHARLVDLARRHAAQLRAEANDDFWHEAGHGARRAVRSAVRFAASLGRHRRLRAGQAA